MSSDCGSLALEVRGEDEPFVLKTRVAGQHNRRAADRSSREGVEVAPKAHTARRRVWLRDR